MAINERVITGTTEEAGNGGAGSGNQEEGLILHLDANDVDSYDGDGSVWYDITNHEYKPTTNVSEHFNTVLYDGTGNSVTIDAGFAPDLVWLKRRDNGNANHTLVDTVRGANSRIYSNLPDSAATNGSFSFNSDGTFDTNSVSSQSKASSKHVAWCFKAGGAAVSNTDGSIASQVSANTDLGFSIVKHTGTSSNTSIGHGLGIAPELIITKNTIDSSNWSVNGSVGGLVYGTNKLQLHTTAALANDYNEVLSANGTTFTVGGSGATNGNNDAIIHYCFASKRGVSKVGSYIGTGAAGNKVYTGFEPAFVMVKASNYVENWIIYDNKRSTDDPRNEILLPNSNLAELSSTNYNIDFDRDGFTINSLQNFVNRNGINYIYLAFAKNTNETSLIPGTDLELHLDIGNSSCYSGSGTTVNDLSSNNHTITTLAGVQEADFDDEVGNFLTVKENSNEGLSIADHADFDHNNGATYEGWVYLDPNGTSEETFLWRGPSSNGQGLRVYWHASYGWFPRDFNSSGTEIIDQNNIKTGTTGFGRGKWYHLALTLSSASAATYKFYVDGDLIGSYTASGGGQNSLSYDISLGKYVGGGVTDLQGAIGQFRFYSTALSHTQIRQNFNFTKNDYPNGYNGTISGATWNSGGYFNFDGSNDYVSLNQGNNMSGGLFNNFSISYWVKLDTTSATGRQFYTYSSGSNYIILYYNHSLGGMRFGGSNVTTQQASYTMSANTWYHIVVTQSSSNASLYVNTSREINHNQLIGTYGDMRVTLGAADQNGTVSNSLDGKISKFKLYDKILTTTEIDTLYNEGE